MPDKLLDLDKIPAQNPFGNYRSWLLWKISTLLVGETLRLPIFSAYEILRFQSGIVLTNNATNQFFATGVDAAVNLVEAIETHDFTVTNSYLRSIMNVAKARKLKNAGNSANDIARVLKCGRSKVIFYLSQAS